jgi:23S rRNA (pseudouridine1915-N3)-methyltransferase
MWQVTILAAGKIKEKGLAGLIAEYLKRIKPYAIVKVIELNAEPFIKSNKKQAKQKEGERINKFLDQQRNSWIVVLDERGNNLDSFKFSDWLEDAGVPIVFVIGGALGLNEEIIRRADKVIALSKLTFTHEVARLLLVEQLYRAATIKRGKEYHY